MVEEHNICLDMGIGKRLERKPWRVQRKKKVGNSGAKKKLEERQEKVRDEGVQLEFRIVV